MKKIVIFFIVVITLITPNCYAISVSSHSACMMDTNSGRILYSKNMNDEHLIASITKIMTAILAIESGKLDEIVEVGEEVLTMYGTNIYVEVGEEVKLIDLVYGLLLRSGNDASRVIAKAVGGTEENFVRMMNDKAKEIGMKNTTFNNPHGLDEETKNYSTAYDMSLLSSYAYQNPIYKEITGTKKYSLQTNKKSYLWYNRNKILSLYEYATGGKTGYTPSAGKTLVTTAEKDGLSLTITTLNDGNQYDTHQKLYEYVFDNYKYYKILDKNKFKIDESYYKDKLYILEDFSYPLTEDETDNIKVIVSLTKLNSYQDDEEVGEVSVLLNERELYKEKVYVTIKNNKKSIWERIKDWFN